MGRFIASVVVIAGFAGCTHMQLKHNAVHQAETLSELYTQQVMDNLAKFVYDPHSMPDFAVAASGTNTVNDLIGANSNISWNTFRFTGAIFTPQTQRQMNQSWTLNPVNDPHKIQLMRCAYRYAVASCGIIDASEIQSCPECDKLLEAFHAHDAKSGGLGDACVKGLASEPWFGMGCKKDVPKDCGCIYVGKYCDQYVWVLPGNRDKLSTLTLAILDYATQEAPATAKNFVEVTTERDAQGNIVKTTRKETFAETKRDAFGNEVYLPPRPSSRGETFLRDLDLQLRTLE